MSPEAVDISGSKFHIRGNLKKFCLVEQSHVFVAGSNGSIADALIEAGVDLSRLELVGGFCGYPIQDLKADDLGKIISCGGILEILKSTSDYKLYLLIRPKELEKLSLLNSIKSSHAES